MPEFRYTNPITSGEKMSLRDHQVLKVGDAWYMTGTAQPVWGGPNPGVKLYVSTDLLHWTFHGLLIDASTLPADCPYNGRFWASEIHATGGRFYLTVNSGHAGPAHGERRMDDHNVWLFVADAVTGPYAPASDRPLGTGFKNDASLFTDDEDGRTYCYCSGGGLWQAAIDLKAGRLAGDFQRVASPSDPGLPEWMIGGIEGPYVIKRHGSYWMFFSAWTRGYEVGVMRAPSPLGPWKLVGDQPLFGTRKRRYREQSMATAGHAHLQFTDTPDPFVEVGHCAIFEGPDGNDWVCGHYFTEGTRRVPGPTPEAPQEYADSWPQLGIEPLVFRDGLPHVDGPTWTEQMVKW